MPREGTDYERALKMWTNLQIAIFNASGAKRCIRDSFSGAVELADSADKDCLMTVRNWMKKIVDSKKDMQAEIFRSLPFVQLLPVAEDGLWKCGLCDDDWVESDVFAMANCFVETVDSFLHPDTRRRVSFRYGTVCRDILYGWLCKLCLIVYCLCGEEALTSDSIIHWKFVKIIEFECPDCDGYLTQKRDETNKEWLLICDDCGHIHPAFFRS